MSAVVLAETTQLGKLTTLTENLKLQLSPGLVASYDIEPGNGVGLFWDKHTHVYLFTYLPRTHTGHFLMADQHTLGYLVPYHGMVDLHTRGI